MQKTVTKWRLTDKNIPVAERTFDSREEALFYLNLAWNVYPDMKRVRLSKFDITTEVITREQKAQSEPEPLAPLPPVC
jgi:hypothetical protein